MTASANRLEAVQRVRALQHDQAQLSFALAVRAQAEAESAVAAAEHAARSGAGTPTRADHFALHRAGALTAAARAADAGCTALKAAEQTAHRRAALLTAHQRVETLDRLADAQERRWAERVARTSRAELDDIAATSWQRRNR